MADTRPLTLGAVLAEGASQHGAADALVFPDSRLSHSQLHARAAVWAKALLAAGVSPGEHVGLLLTTRPEFVEILFGIALAGAVAVPVNARYQAGELAYLVKDADLRILVTTGRVADSLDFSERLHAALPSLGHAPDSHSLSLAEAPLLRRIVCVDAPVPTGLVGATEFLEAGSQVAEREVARRADAVDPQATALILYTSGTTSHPKGCLIRHRGIVGNSRNLARRYGILAGDRFWSPLPIFHIAGILPLVASLDAGGAYLTIPAFEPGEALAMLERERATHAYPCFVTIMQDLISHHRFASTDLSSVRLMNSNFAVQPDWIRDAMAKAMPGCIQVGTYGLTEAAGTVCTSRPDDSYE
ncbi:MAG: AMP-binding protein, partial [Thermaurantiacus sp.]